MDKIAKIAHFSNFFFSANIIKMPRKTYRRRPRKNFRRKRQSKPKLLSIGPYMPQSIICKHKMAVTYALSQNYQDTGIGDEQLQSFRVNSLYDADTSVSGAQQPRMMDEMKELYSTYRVLGCKIFLKFINLSQEPVYVMGLLGDQQLSASDSHMPSDIREMKGSQVKILHSLDSGNKSVQTLVFNYSPARIEGCSKARIRNDPTFEALSTSHPEELHFLSTAIHQVSTSLGETNNATVQVEATFHWTALWNDRKILPDSN